MPEPNLASIGQVKPIIHITLKNIWREFKFVISNCIKYLLHKPIQKYSIKAIRLVKTCSYFNRI